MTAFQVRDRVRALVSAQQLVAGAEYFVASLEHGQFQTVTYYLAPAAQPAAALPVVNGHLLLELVESQAQAAEVCAWCKKVTREGSLPATHGICPSCLAAT